MLVKDLGVALRRNREKPQRTPAHERERAELCDRLRRRPLAYFTDTIDMIIDTKRFQVPTTPEGRAFLAKQRVVAQLRTRAEGLQNEFTIPSPKRDRRNVGGTVNVCAGICAGKVALWEYVDKWNGEVAKQMYRGPIMRTLKRRRGHRESYLLAEDNDPSGYKSGKAMAEKRRFGHHDD